MRGTDFVQLYLSLFAARPDLYAIRTEWEKNGTVRQAYLPSVYQSDKESKQYTVEKVTRITDAIGSREYGAEAVMAHLMGEHFLGVYPLYRDSSVRFFAIDFDKKKDDDPDPYVVAIEQQRILEREAGLKTYLEISRGGKGFHLWGFLDGAVDARKLRIALAPFLVASDSLDRMFPNQDSVSELRPWGNLIALPLFGPSVAKGRGVFVAPGAPEDGPVPYANQRAFLQQIERIPVDTVIRLFQDAPEAYHRPEREIRPHLEDPEGMSGAFKLISPYGCEWMRWHWESPEERREPDWYMLACQLAQFENGRELFHQFSARSSRYDPDQTDAKYDHALTQNAPHTCEYIRENTSGPACNCDLKWPDKVRRPYDVAALSIAELVDAQEREAYTTDTRRLIVRAYERAKLIEADPKHGIGLAYGIGPLDERTSLRPGELIIIGARPSIGKTALGNAIAVHIVNEQESNAYCMSQEMTADQLGMRFLASEAKVDHGKLITGRLEPEEWKRVQEAMKRVQDRHRQIFVDDRTRDTAEMLDVVGEWVFEHGKGPLIIDYLQLAKKRKGESTFDAVSRFAYEYKWMAKILDIPVIALTQLNRTADEATEDSATYDHWLRASGDIEQAADVIIFMLGEKSGEDVSSRTLAIHKERHRGAGHRVPVDFHQGYQLFGPEGTYSRGRRVVQGGSFDIGTPLRPLRRPMLIGGWGEDDDEV